MRPANSSLETSSARASVWQTMKVWKRGIMETTFETSLVGLLRHFREETLVLVKQELQLARVELSQKLRTFGRMGALMACGLLLANAGLIVFLVALGLLIGAAMHGGVGDES